jgi:hypothetical protein
VEACKVGKLGSVKNSVTGDHVGYQTDPEGGGGGTDAVGMYYFGHFFI